MRHHFVPQFYLRNFANRHRRGAISLFRKSDGLYVPSASIKAQAQRDRLYGSADREQSLGRLETLSSNVLRNIIERRVAPRRFSGSHEILMTHILFQAARTPKAAEELIEFVGLLSGELLKQSSSSSNHVPVGSVMFPNPVLETLSNAASSIPLVKDLAVKLLVNNTGIPLITSDSPVIYYNQLAERFLLYGQGLGIVSRGLQLFLPASPDICVMCYDYDAYKVGGRSLSGVQVQLTSTDVFGLNVLQVLNAQDQLFASDDMPPSILQTFVETANSLPLRVPPMVESFPIGTDDAGNPVEVVWTTKTAPHVGLQLSQVSLLPSITRLTPAQMTEPREPLLAAVHDAFEQHRQQMGVRSMSWRQYVRSLSLMTLEYVRAEYARKQLAQRQMAVRAGRAE